MSTLDMDRIIVMWTPGDRQAVAGLLTSSLSLIRASGDVLVVTSWTFGLNNVQLVRGRGGGQVRDLKEIAHQQNDGGHSE